ncbi:MAG: GNAT family N-acetyltransferase [Ignavibacteriales bacterium]
MSNKIILNTERLILREAQITDSQFFYNLLNMPKWIKYIGDRGIKTLRNAEDYIKDKLINSYKTNGYGLYVFELKESHIPVGICGFINRDYLDSVDIGFALLTEYERKGYTFEIARAVLSYGEDQLGFTKVYAITSTDNTASQELLKKLGFKFNSIIVEPSSNEELSLYSRESVRL